MLMNALKSLLIADYGAIVAWTITALLTFLVGLPRLHLLVLTLADDDSGFDRRVRDIEQYLKATERAHAARRYDPVNLFWLNQSVPPAREGSRA